MQQSEAELGDAVGRYSIADAQIEEMRQSAMALRIDGIDDREGFKVVRSARMTVRNHRTAIERLRARFAASVVDLLPADGGASDE